MISEHSEDRPGIQLIVGLGNPGPQYAATRHNVGYWFVQKLCEQHHQNLMLESKFKASVGTIKLSGKTCRVIQPITFMNLSGQAVSSVANFYKIPSQQILVVHDELDLPVGTSRLKFEGGHGGHNGLRDIISQLGGNAFYRIRLGIGHPGNRDEVHDYVLHKPSLSDHDKIMTAIEHTLDVLPEVIEGKFDKAMNKLHTVTK